MVEKSQLRLGRRHEAEADGGAEETGAGDIPMHVNGSII
jgi:hypothetical protein